MKINKRMLSIIFLTIITISWGISFISIKIIMDFSGPVYTALFRYVISVVVTLLFALKVGGLEKLRKEDLPRMVGTSLIGVTLYFYCENLGILYISPGAAAVIISLAPVATMILHRFLSGIKISIHNMVCVSVSIVGVYLVIGGSGSLSGDWKGYGFMLAAVVAWSVYLVLTKPLFQRYSNISVTLYQSIFGTIGFLPLLWGDYIHWENWNGKVAGHYIFLGLMCTALCNYLYMYALNHGGIHLSAIFLNLIPVATLIFSYFLLGDRIELLQAVGVIITVVSVSLVRLQRE